MTDLDIMSECLREDLPARRRPPPPRPLPLSETRKKEFRKREESSKTASDKGLLQTHLKDKGLFDRKPSGDAPSLYFSCPFPQPQPIKAFISALEPFFPSDDDGRPTFPKALGELSTAMNSAAVCYFFKIRLYIFLQMSPPDFVSPL